MHLAAHGLQHSCRTDGARAGSHRNSPGSKNAARRWYCESPCDANDSLPSVDVIRAAQRKGVADLGDNLRSFPTTFGQVTLADDDLFRLRVGNRDVLWIPSGDKALQVRLMACAHMRSAGHRLSLIHISEPTRPY